ncbi:MAG: hypothetical protein QN120_14685 [Armatimonadota bacterium]|nr:hypothetical protein [Armatimonadota bacterium]
MDQVLIITQEGTVTGVWSDDIPWQEFGQVACHRLSSVEWDPARQEWVATDLATGRTIAAGPTRTQVLQAEASYYNALLASGTAPEVKP